VMTLAPSLLPRGSAPILNGWYLEGVRVVRERRSITLVRSVDPQG